MTLSHPSKCAGLLVYIVLYCTVCFIRKLGQEQLLVRMLSWLIVLISIEINDMKSIQRHLDYDGERNYSTVDQVGTMASVLILLIYGLIPESQKWESTTPAQSDLRLRNRRNQIQPAPNRVSIEQGCPSRGSRATCGSSKNYLLLLINVPEFPFHFYIIIFKKYHSECVSKCILNY